MTFQPVRNPLGKKMFPCIESDRWWVDNGLSKFVLENAMSAIRSLIAVAAMASAGALAQDRPPKVGETRDLPKEPPAVSEKSVDPVRKSEPAADKPQDNPSKGQPAEKVDKPDQKSDSVKPNPTQDERNKARAKRRPVHAVIETMPRSGRSVSYGPVLNPVTPALVRSTGCCSAIC